MTVELQKKLEYIIIQVASWHDLNYYPEFAKSRYMAFDVIDGKVHGINVSNTKMIVKEINMESNDLVYGMDFHYNSMPFILYFTYMNDDKVFLEEEEIKYLSLYQFKEEDLLFEYLLKTVEVSEI